MGHNQSRMNSCVKRQQQQQLNATFPDLRKLPPEVAIAILANLNATDLCLAACVWDELGTDEVLWKRYADIIFFLGGIHMTYILSGKDKSDQAIWLCMINHGRRTPFDGFKGIILEKCHMDLQRVKRV